jgi:hypothetical protein
MAAPLNTCTTIEQRGVVRFLWAKIMEAAKDIHKEMLPIRAATNKTKQNKTPRGSVTDRWTTHLNTKLEDAM